MTSQTPIFDLDTAIHQLSSSPDSPEEARSEDMMASLIISLRQVQAFAEGGFWLNGFELCELLGLSLEDLVNSKGDPFAELQWRNFRIHYQGAQRGIRYWSLSQNIQRQAASSAPAGSLNSTLQVARAQAETLRQAAPVVDVTSKFIQFRDILSPEQLQELLGYTFANESRFERSGYRPDPNYPDYRRSMVLYQFSPHMEYFQRLIQSMVPETCQQLGIPSFEVSHIEAQLTMHNHDNYYKIHNDNASEDTATRRLTYVYYYYREPQGFAGGKLRFYNRVQSQVNLPGEEHFVDIEPYNNSLILFPSQYMHEVMRVDCDSRAFHDSRFTINGWVREKTEDTAQRSPLPSPIQPQPLPSNSTVWMGDLFT
jgi:Rps23 Pro-64 3,4-dihydroxylase Tpa1-like proline 4-hydroxylase